MTVMQQSDNRTACSAQRRIFCGRAAEIVACGRRGLLFPSLAAMGVRDLPYPSRKRPRYRPGQGRLKTPGGDFHTCISRLDSTPVLALASQRNRSARRGSTRSGRGAKEAEVWVFSIIYRRPGDNGIGAGCVGGQSGAMALNILVICQLLSAGCECGIFIDPGAAERAERPSQVPRLPNPGSAARSKMADVCVLEWTPP